MILLRGIVAFVDQEGLGQVVEAFSPDLTEIPAEPVPVSIDFDLRRIVGLASLSLTEGRVEAELDLLDAAKPQLPTPARGAVAIFSSPNHGARIVHVGIVTHHLDPRVPPLTIVQEPVA